jgi:hypothetical protein
MPAEVDRSRAARIVTWAILLLNFALLVWSLPDYRVSIDSGYHISLAEWYAAHGSGWWDHINFGPGGRPNLQGPALHIAIAILGTLLGGSPDSFILANAMLAIEQWAAAMLTALYFARRLGGDIAAMFAVALLAGSAFAAGSFYVGIPSGWLFISIPWAIHFFLEDRLILATLITSLACYTHLGGFLTAPVGIAVAAAVERRWRALAKVAVATAILTAPYSLHFLMNLDWYRGKHGHEALRLDPLIDLLAIAGSLWLFRRPREHKFLLAWAAAPIAWLIQDPNRFAAQSALAGAVIGGLFLTDLLRMVASARIRIAVAAAVVALATIFPLGIPSLLAEGAWDAGLRYPRALDWNESRALAAIIARSHLNDRLLWVYETSMGPSIAVFMPVVLYRGHWVEVQPRRDRADDLSAGVQAYVWPLAPDDPELKVLAAQGLVRVYGGTADSCVFTLPRAGDPAQLAPAVQRVLEENAAWLGENAVNNTLPPPDELLKMLTRAALEAHQRKLDVQRFHAARMGLACLVYAYALEGSRPGEARALRGVARGFGSMASFLSDGDPVGYVSDAGHAQFRANMLALAHALEQSNATLNDSPQVREAVQRLFHDYFGTGA